MKLIMRFSFGHNTIWISWAFLQIPTWLWAWPTFFGFESMLEGYVDHAKPKFWSISLFLSPKSTCLGRYTFILDTLYNTLCQTKKYPFAILWSKPLGIHDSIHCQNRFTKIWRFGIYWYKSDVFLLLRGKFLPNLGRKVQMHSSLFWFQILLMFW